MPLPLYAVALGANALGGLLKTRSEQGRLKKVRTERLAALRPLEAQAATNQYGLSQPEGNIARQVTQSTLSDLSSRGILDSTAAAPAVAAAVAPVQFQHDQANQALLENIAAQKQAIASDTSAPGYGLALGGALGDAGDYLAMLQGQRDARKRRAEEQDYMMQLIKQSQIHGAAQNLPYLGTLGSAPWGSQMNDFNSRYPLENR